MAPVHTQPAILEIMDPFRSFDEKHDSLDSHGHSHSHSHSHGQQCESGDECSNGHQHGRRCHNSRLRRLLFPALAAFFMLSALFALSCVYDTSGLFEMGLSGLARRATGDTTSGNNGTFVDKKYYIIVIVVGFQLTTVQVPSKIRSAARATSAHAAVVSPASNA
ncbi:hypothetical protein H0H81_010239 [Sphagnurus paluster]|uniref:Uncharacterized protein n=1 Tax=Sphagnurus paluster TaxID=117069 RepID=A0A9P7FP78_9AGAR|nr:hypothetical protein H0H81_010239 [Sphagnurus paluster]